MATSTDKHRFLTLKVNWTSKEENENEGDDQSNWIKRQSNNLKQKSPNFPLVGNKIAQTSQVGNLKVIPFTRKGGAVKKERKRAKLPPQLIMPTNIPKYRCFYPYAREPRQLFVLLSCGLALCLSVSVLCRTESRKYFLRSPGPQTHRCSLLENI